MNRKSKVPNNGILKRKILTDTVANEALFFFSIGMLRGYLTPQRVSAQIANEKNEMTKFGIDTSMLQLLADYYQKTETPTMTMPISKQKAALVAYQYLVFCASKGSNIIRWLATIPLPFRNIFNFPTALLRTTTLEQLVIQKCLIHTVLKDPTAKLAERHFSFEIITQSNIIKNQFTYPMNELGIEGFTLAGLREFVGCLVIDVASLNRTENVDTVAAKKAFFATGLSFTVIIDIVNKHKSFFAEEAGCLETKITEWVNEYKKHIDLFNMNEDPTIDAVFMRWQVKGINPERILTMGKFDQWISSSVTESISKQNKKEIVK